MVAKYAEAMSHYIADMVVFGHVMDSRTYSGAEIHHKDYETYVNSKTSSYKAEFDSYLSFDGSLSILSAYDAALKLAYNTTFDSSINLGCLWTSLSLSGLLGVWNSSDSPRNSPYEA